MRFSLENEKAVIALVLKAQKDSEAADKFIKQYVPFVKAETSKFTAHSIFGNEDEYSIALFAFYEALMSFNPNKGAFFSFARTAIRNRLIDYSRKENKHTMVVSLNEKVNEDEDKTLEETIKDDRNEIEEFVIRSAAKVEMEEFSTNLAEYGLTLSDIADNCPKQERTFTACMKVLDYAISNPTIFDHLLLTKKLPISTLVKGAGVDKKTLERQRKYLLGILLAYTNGFEIIRGHLDLNKKEVLL